MIAINSNKAVSPGSYEAEIACEGCTIFIFLWYVIIKVLSSLLKPVFQVVTFLSALYNSVTL